eukprot:g20518.t1
MSEADFRLLMNQDACATEKTAEGLRAFIADTDKLEAWTVVALQNTGTILCSVFLHICGKVILRQLKPHQVLPLLVDAVLLVVDS